MKVNCEKCDNSFEVSKGYYQLNLKRHSKFYCSNECRNGTPLNRLLTNISIDENGCWNYTKSGRGKAYYNVI